MNFLFPFTPGSSKNPPQERKATPTPRDVSATKSPLPDQQTYERLLQNLGASTRLEPATEMYRQIPLAFDPAALPRGIPIDPGTATAHFCISCFMCDVLEGLSSPCLVPD